MINHQHQTKDIIEAIRDPFGSVDMSGRLRYCNEAFCDMVGYTRSELYSMTYVDLTPAKWHAMEAGIIQDQVLANGFSEIYEKEYRRKDGSVLPVELLVSLKKNQDGTPAEMMAVVRDISERKLIEQERKSVFEFLQIVNASITVEELIAAALRHLQESSGCSAVGIRIREEEDYPYYVAQGFPSEFLKAENMLCNKTSHGEIIRDSSGIPVLDCMCGNVIRGRFDCSKPFFTSNGSFWTNSTTELLATTSEADRQSGTRNTCNRAGYESVALIPLVVGKDRLGLLQLNDFRKGIFSAASISMWETLAGYLAIALKKFQSEEALKKLNEQLDLRIQARTSRLETALKELESFSYSVSHDLRAPLRHINSYIAMVVEDFGDLLPPEAHANLERSRTASRQMGKLIDDLLELSRVGRTTLAKESVNLSDLAQSACAALHEAEPCRHVDFVVGKGHQVHGDRSLLMQMMVNLLENAWKYSAVNPTARIEFGKVSTSGQEAFYVKDNGVGFDMAFSDKLFGPFQRLHGTEFEGTGIGLATVKRIIERHGGSIWAESKPDEGATFYFTLQGA
ncbi:ATP-binding protein [Geomonas anaerohicana]|uniref:histidine kinase n=1 Tax=Geomonas anaerohicana TaxID=2798583 RepID=A0ABS0YC77_9BACT|nr:ATP-binding protein [Geomonas anaerohicana]MBJ6749905.1 PAS domain S-box protein [Geomonas anaerohicana]